jgi:hypothetical protein
MGSNANAARREPWNKGKIAGQKAPFHTIEGSFAYRSGQSIYLLEPGDTLIRQGEVLHGPERWVQLPIRFVCTIVYPNPTVQG